MTTSVMRRTIVTSLSAVVVLFAGPLSGTAYASHSGGVPHSASSLRPASSSGLSLCQLSSKVNRLIVTRNHNVNPISFTFPATLRSSDNARVQALARALCALPKPPSTTMYCVADFGVRYSLHFWEYLGNEAVAEPDARVVVVDPWGCEFVTGLGNTRWTDTRPQFWTLLGAVIGLPHATRTTFAGKVANG